MEISSKTDYMLLSACVFLAVVLFAVIILLIMERKKITQVTINNADDDIYPSLKFTSPRQATVEDQTFSTNLGKVLVSSDETKTNADTKSAVIVQVLDGPASFTAEGASVKLVICNKTESPIHVNGGHLVTKFNAAMTGFKHPVLVGSIPPVTAPAKGSATTHFCVTGAESAAIDSVKFQLGLSVVKAPEVET